MKPGEIAKYDIVWMWTGLKYVSRTRTVFATHTHSQIKRNLHTKLINLVINFPQRDAGVFSRSISVFCCCTHVGRFSLRLFFVGLAMLLLVGNVSPGVVVVGSGDGASTPQNA